VAVRRGATFKDMAATLRRFRVSALPVIDDEEKVIGVAVRDRLSYSSEYPIVAGPP
jgi:CBS domain-containing protein